VAGMRRPDELPEVTRLRVIYGDTDQMGMVYYANYLRYFEAGRNELLRSLGLSYRAFEEAEGRRLPVVEATVRYRRPARYDDELAIHAAIPEVARASLRFVYAIRRLADGEDLVTGQTVHACIDAAGKPARIPEAVRVLLAGRGQL
jgi:acyl-CoA thioester hydrolase